MFKQNIKSGIIQGITILLVLTIGGVGYAAFTNFTSLQATPTETLTADKWNNLVDAVKDEYSTSETLTNKVWINGKPIYRKVIDCGSFAGNKTCPTNIPNIDLMWIVDFIENNGAGQIAGRAASHYISGTQARLAYIKDYNQIYIQWYTSNNHHFYFTVEYTKTTD